MVDQALDTSTRLAIDRTRLAHERTLMAWVRTSTSLIAFGFTIFKFFEYIAENYQRRQPIVSPWVLGMLLILIGIVALALAWLQHRQEMKSLAAEFGTMRSSIAGLMAGLIACLGAVALVAVFFRV